MREANGGTPRLADRAGPRGTEARPRRLRHARLSGQSSQLCCVRFFFPYELNFAWANVKIGQWDVGGGDVCCQRESACPAADMLAQ